MTQGFRATRQRRQCLAASAHARWFASGTLPLRIVRVALRWPQHFLVMFDLPSSRDKYPEYAGAGDEAFATLLKFIVECQETGVLSAGDPEPLAFMAWSMVHGIAKLAAGCHLPFRATAVLDFADHASHVMMAGMGRGN